MVTESNDALRGSINLSSTKHLFSINSPSTPPLSTHRAPVNSLRVCGQSWQLSDSFPGGGSYRAPAPAAAAAATRRERKRYHPLIQQHRNDFSHDVYMLRRRHRSIVTSMKRLQTELEQARCPPAVPHSRASPTKSKRQAMLLTKYNPSSTHDLDASLLASKLSGLVTHEPSNPARHRRSWSRNVDDDDFSMPSKRDLSLSMLPPLTKDGSFLINQFYD